jgi:hypothetical protein
LAGISIDGYVSVTWVDEHEVTPILEALAAFGGSYRGALPSRYSNRSAAEILARHAIMIPVYITDATVGKQAAGNAELWSPNPIES